MSSLRTMPEILSVLLTSSTTTERCPETTRLPFGSSSITVTAMRPSTSLSRSCLALPLWLRELRTSMSGSTLKASDLIRKDSRRAASVVDVVRSSLSSFLTLCRSRMDDRQDVADVSRGVVLDPVLGRALLLGFGPERLGTRGDGQQGQSDHACDGEEAHGSVPFAAEGVVAGAERGSTRILRRPDAQ